MGNVIKKEERNRKKNGIENEMNEYNFWEKNLEYYLSIYFCFF